MTPLDGLSFQLYSARLMDSLDAQFELLAGLGYRKVEPFGGLLGDADRLRALLDKHGMTAPTCHVGMDRLRADPVAAVRLCRGLGIETIYAPAPPPGERDGGEAEWTAIGRELAAINKAVTGEGLKFGWHNHAFEFGKTPAGRTYMEILLQEAPDMLWEVDIAWVIRGKGDPAAMIKAHAGRIEAVHVKDIAPEGQCTDEDGWADPGHGVLDWATLVPLLQQIGVKHYVAEHDKPNDVARFARRARETVASWR